MSETHFRYIQVRIVGSLDDFAFEYTPSFDDYGSPGAAQNAGIRALCHDDFIVGEFSPGDVCIATYSDGVKRDDPEEIEEINKSLGVISDPESAVGGA